MQTFDNLDVDVYAQLLRYDQVVHLVSAANGAEEHYTRWSKLGEKGFTILFRSNNKTRTEDIELAKTNDRLVGEAWVGHPYYELIDNSTDFETKMRRLCRYCTEQTVRGLMIIILQGCHYKVTHTSCGRAVAQ